MALTLSQLRRMDYGAAIGGVSLGFWSYITNDPAATVETAGYFNGATSYLNKGDIIQAVCAYGTTPVNKQYVVTSATGAATVVVALQTTIAG